MPRLDPFTALCRQTARKPLLDRADLHLHTTHSDGTYTPAQVVELALRCGLSAIAITDHDTLDGIEPARTAAVGSGLEIVPGVEITTEYEGRELHLLAYFIDTDNLLLRESLDRLRQDRVARFETMIDRLSAKGVSVPRELLPTSGSLGRRHLAEMLVQTRQVGTVREAFRRYLHDGGCANVPKRRLPIAEAMSCVRAAGGVASWAHPPENFTRQQLSQLRDWGLDAIEADYPGFRQRRVTELKSLAKELNLLTTGGSDCHGSDTPGRALGCCTISLDELESLRQRHAQLFQLFSDPS